MTAARREIWDTRLGMDHRPLHPPTCALMELLALSSNTPTSVRTGPSVLATAAKTHPLMTRPTHLVTLRACLISTEPLLRGVATVALCCACAVTPTSFGDPKARFSSRERSISVLTTTATS
jgi:hypothetical protein